MASADKNRTPVRCVSCDALLPAGASACPVCRAPVPAPVGPVSELRACVHCGAVAPAEALRCSVCGVVIPRPAPGEARRRDR